MKHVMPGHLVKPQCRVYVWASTAEASWHESNSCGDVSTKELCLVIATNEEGGALVLSSQGVLGWFEQFLMESPR